MFAFNPISYFIKSFIRLFTRKFFWVIFILVCLFLGFVLFNNNGVFAESTISFNENYITSGDISAARYKVGETIWNDESYDIFIHYNAGTGTNCVTYFQPSLDYPTVYYDLVLGSGSTNNYRYSNLSLIANGSTASRSIVHCKSLSNNWTEDLSASSSNNSVYCYTFYSTQANPSSILCKPIRTHYNIYDGNGNIVFNATNPVFVSPYFVNSNDIATWSFDNLTLNLGSVTYNESNYYGLDYEYNGVRYSIDLGIYYNSNDNCFYIPKNILTNDIVIRNGNDIFFQFSYRDMSNVVLYDLGTFTLDLTSEEQEQANQDSEKALQGQILNEQQKTNDKLDETNDKLDDLQNTITDTTVPSDTEFDLPTIEVNDTTSNFFDTLFTGIYNAFNINEDITISFTIFSKTITINSGDFRMLNDSNFNVLRLLLESSWYFAIGYMVLKDIRLIFDKIKNGNIENAVSNDIKADMV